MNPSRFLTHSLQSSPHGQRVVRVLAAGLEAVEPNVAVKRSLQKDGNTLFIKNRSFPLSHFQRGFLTGAGKAGVPMAQAVVEILGDALTDGIVIVKEGHTEGTIQKGAVINIGPVTVLEAGHPLPDQRGIDGTRHIINLLSRIGEGDLVICLISGGGSALLTQPSSDISLGDLRRLTDQLLACGATIHEINTLRKHLDQVKGGQLARLAVPATVVTLILSDVVGDDLDIIASGPTVPDPGTFGDAVKILEKHEIFGKIPTRIRHFLERGVAGAEPETPKPGDSIFCNVDNVLVGSNRQAAEAAIKSAVEEGFQARVLTTTLEGEAREQGRWLGSVARDAVLKRQPLGRPACLVAGGESTVTLRGGPSTSSGRGGRNQEMALAAVEALAGLPDIALVTMATDGGDGPTDAAGAVVTGETLARAQDAGLAPNKFLARNDSYAFFDALEDLLRPGPTQTNVNDLAFVFVF